MTENTGKVISVNGNLISVEFNGIVSMNEICYIKVDDAILKSEVIRIRGNVAQIQVYEMTNGIKCGDLVEFTGEMLSAELGPGLLGQIYDGLQNPLPVLAKQAGWFLERGIYANGLNTEKKWEFTPTVEAGNVVRAGEYVGTVPEGSFLHKIFVPFYLLGNYTVKSVAPKGEYTVKETVAVLINERGREIPLTMSFKWPVKRAVKCYSERLAPTEMMETKVRLVDSFFPVAKGGTYCTPGPFGAGKTVLQHTTSKYADVDIVIIAACGERAGEVVETLTEFPELIDPKTNRSLMERTIIICNTSSMPVASREASVYTSVTLAEYYRQMGLHVLLLADSTSRWAQALREMSGRLEEIPGEEAFPAYLESYIAAFYERAGYVRLPDGSTGSVTIGGTVSPAGGNFEEPVTQATLKVVGAFHGLSRERSDARKYPAIDPLISWSKYKSVIDREKIEFCKNVLHHGFEISSMMKVVGEEGTTLTDYVTYLKSEMLDAVYLQQNSFDLVDANCGKERQRYVVDKLVRILGSSYSVENKDEARSFFNNLRQKFIDWNYAEFKNEEFSKLEAEIDKLYCKASGKLSKLVQKILEDDAQ
ncbi:MAG: V-type ATP synthase subunit A [Clostridia bacterium]|nr:V-type ATP synthase subunit A [Clostridia bacterium]MBR2499437.1 V-type ATP synthase subunit A [Clostridia bacterium]